MSDDGFSDLRNREYIQLQLTKKGQSPQWSIV
jgi:DNA-binding CsgD family transcriptional regulator